MIRFTRVLAAAALVAGLPMAAMAADGPNPGGRGAQTLYLHTTTPVDIVINPACSALSADPINFSSVTPTNAGSGAQQNFNVYFTCGAGVAPRVTFTSTNGAANSTACELTGPGNPIIYDVYDFNNIVAGAGLCQAGGGQANGPYYQSNGVESNHLFQAQVQQLVSGSPGSTVYPKAGAYHDDLNVFLEF